MNPSSIGCPVRIVPVAQANKCLAVVQDAVILVDIVQAECIEQHWTFDGKCFWSGIQPSKALQANGTISELNPQQWLFVNGYLLVANDLNICLQINQQDMSIFLTSRGHEQLFEQQWCLDPVIYTEEGVVHVERSPPQALDTTTKRVDLVKLSVRQIVYWLTKAQLPKTLVQMCQTNEINGEALSYCATVSDLLEIGITDSKMAAFLLQQIEKAKRDGIPSTELPFMPSPFEIYRIHSAKVPSKCIHLASGASGHAPNGDRCHLWSTIWDSHHHAQEWIFDDPLIKSVKDPTKCIHLASGASATSFNGDICHLWSIVSGQHLAQEWIIDGPLIRSAKCPTKCIHLASGSSPSFNGDICHLWDIQDGDYPPQEWIFIPAANPPPSDSR